MPSSKNNDLSPCQPSPGCLNTPSEVQAQTGNSPLARRGSEGLAFGQHSDRWVRKEGLRWAGGPPQP